MRKDYICVEGQQGGRSAGLWGVEGAEIHSLGVPDGLDDDGDDRTATARGNATPPPTEEERRKKGRKWILRTKYGPMNERERGVRGRTDRATGAGGPESDGKLSGRTADSLDDWMDGHGHSSANVNQAID